MSVAEPLSPMLARALPLGKADRAAAAAEAQATIAKGSKSFAAAARLFGTDTRASAMMLYAWCRHCDDVVDDQILGFARRSPVGAIDAEARLNELETKTLAAIRGRHTGEGAFDAIGDVALRHRLPEALPLQHLAGFRMDVEGRRYETLRDTLDYCYHVAGVVGVMMAVVMGVGRDERETAKVTETLDRASDLGIAFQLTNIARDVAEDFRAGRLYLPCEWLDEMGIRPDELGEPRHRETLAQLVLRLVDLADGYYASALHGLAALPPRAAWAVATAHGVYREIGTILRNRGAQALDARAKTGAVRKIAHVGHGMRLVAASRLARTLPQRSNDLWTRPRIAGLDA
ncbi:MAG: phytoene/squalene synthase family protein [Pseudomonadota bacterium]|nr:phytoene/squalene synthase family protein [Pseudomonadota bacterium]